MENELILRKGKNVAVSKSSKAEAILNFLCLKDDPRKADVIFILGSSSDGPIEKAASLYRAGYAPKIAFTSSSGVFGGRLIWDMDETDHYHFKLLELGIPEEAMLYHKDKESRTDNTLIEAKQAIAFLNKNELDPKKIILVSRPVHQLRAVLTFRKQHTKVEFVSCPSEEDLNSELVPKLLGEVERIQSYGLKGDLENIKIPIEVSEAYKQLKKLIKR